ncbi:MAG TPA: glycosyltransferase family 1 protein [Patescibacteria group bacterium]|nr:MAG: Glycosyl transferase group 1 [Parcubacteria group bacterium GW2011_GWA2_46_39]HLD85841.1 glycosyltransferase family 1 protein [Patescibacteria group bacterium]
MKLGVDIRCLQDKRRTGVGEYAWQVLKELSQDKSISLYGWANAAGRIDLPAGLERLMPIYRGRLPNKLMNLKLWLKFGRPMDKVKAIKPGALDAWWLPNPSFAHISPTRPTLLTVHDLAFRHYPEYFPYKGRLWYFPAVRSLLTRGLPKRSLVVAVSQHTAEDIAQEFPQLKSRLRVAPPGLETRYFDTVPAEKVAAVKQRYQLPPRYLFSLGTIEPRKNYQLLLRLYEEILRREPDFPCDLVIAGGWGWRFKSIRQLLLRLKSRTRIHFIGYVPDDDKAALYAQADLFLFPSLYEGIGLPPLEAMAAGTPVIASQAASLPEVLAEAAMLLSPFLSETWIDNICWLIKDQAARQELSDRGRARARQFSWVKTAAVYKDLWQELTAAT